MSLVWQSVLLFGSFGIRVYKGMRIATPVCALARNDIQILRRAKIQFLCQLMPDKTEKEEGKRLPLHFRIVSYSASTLRT